MTYFGLLLIVAWLGAFAVSTAALIYLATVSPAALWCLAALGAAFVSAVVGAVLSYALLRAEGTL